MELLCPNCLGALAASDGQTARCTVHGGEYRILFSRGQSPTVPPAIGPVEAPLAVGAAGQMGSAEPRGGAPVRLSPAAGAMCQSHANVSAVLACQVCARPMCVTCAFQTNEGVPLCLDCVSRPASTGRGASNWVQTPAILGAAVPPDARCAQHSHLPATAHCRSCGAFMCAACDFQMPGGIHVCPACAAAPRSTLSPKRKRLVGWSYAFAVWTTLILAALFAGAFAGMATDESGESALGILLSFLLFTPSLIGTALGVSALERRLGNPPAIWIAAAWNGLILGCFLLLCVIGMFST